jgi:TonB family protein
MVKNDRLSWLSEEESMKSRVLYLGLLAYLAFQFALEASGEERTEFPEQAIDTSTTAQRAMLLQEFEDAFRQAAAQAQISPQMREDLLASFERENGRRLIRAPELRASLLELLYAKDLPYPVTKSFLLALRDQMSKYPVVDTGFLEAVRQVNLEDREVHKLDNVSGIRPPRPVQQPLPLYTDVARKLGIEGMVLLRAVVLEDGSIANAKVIRGLGYGLDESAVLTIQDRWKFQPATLDGKPVLVQAHIEVSFRLH